MERISRDEQLKAMNGDTWPDCYDNEAQANHLCDAQLTADRAELEKVVREIFSKMKKKYIPSQSSAYEGEVVVVMKESDYDLLISKYLKEAQH